MLTKMHFEKTIDGFTLYDIRLDTELYPMVEVKSWGVLVMMDIGMDLKKTHKTFLRFFPEEALFLYLPEKGLYANRLKTRMDLSEEAAREWFLKQKENRTLLFHEQERNRLFLTLKKMDLKSYGHDVNESGSVIIELRKKQFEVSDKDSNKLFNLALFGGFLGLHRFYAGKRTSGIFYALSAGCFALGWFIDILLLFLSRFKDSDGHLVLPPKDVYKKTIFLFFVTFEACLVLAVYLSIFFSIYTYFA